IDTADPAIVSVIDRSLNSGDEVEQAFTLGLIEDFSLAPWAKTLGNLFQTSESFFIRQKILDMAGQYPDIIPNEALLAIVQQEDADLIDEAIRAAGQRGMGEILPVLETYLDPDHHSAPEVKAASAYAVLTMKQGPLEKAQDTLREMMESTDTNESALALKTLSELPTDIASAVVHESTLREMLHSRSTRARRFILEMVVNPGYWAKEKPADNDTILSVALNLEKSATRQIATQVLRNYPHEHVIEVLTTVLRDKGTPAALKTGIIQTLRSYPMPKVAEEIIDQMDANNVELYSAAVETLLHIARQQPLGEELLTRLNGEMLQVARAIYKNYQLLTIVGQKEPLLAEIIQREIRTALPSMLKLAVMDVPNTQIEMMIEQLQNPSPAVLANILEIFDNVLSKSEREIIIPLFEEHTVNQRAALGRRYFGALTQDADRAIADYVFSRNAWHSLVGLDYVLRHQPELIRDWHRVPTSDANKQIVGRYLRQNGNQSSVPDMLFPVNHGENLMYTTLEKTILLRGVVLFQDIPADEIFHVAQI